jgi:hypothetical protein
MQAKQDQAIFYYNFKCTQAKNKPSMVTLLQYKTISGHPYNIEQLQFPTSDKMCDQQLCTKYITMTDTTKQVNLIN